MDTLTPQEEEQMVCAVKRAVALVDDEGMEPDAAIEKVARDEMYGPGQIRFLCAGYNTGRQNCQRLSNTNVLDKLASFPLADATNVIKSIYEGPSPAEKKAADRVHDDYLAPPTWLADEDRRTAALAPLPGGVEKTAAAAAPVTPAKSLTRQLADVDREKRAADEAGTNAAKAEDRVRGHVYELVQYFKKYANERLPFNFVEKSAEMYQGAVIKPLMDLIYDGAGLTEKRADDSLPVSRQPIRWDRMPFSALRDCMKYARDVHIHRQAQIKHVEKTAQLKEAVLLPFVGATANPSPASTSRLAGSPLYSEKVAGIFGTPAGLAVGSMLGRAFNDVPSKDKLVDDAANDLDDPAHQNEIRKIRTQAMLTNMLSDADDPISGHDPDEVLRAYNELSAMAPQTADQPAALRPLLRRRLEGHTEPFEAKELTEIEKGLTQSKSNPSIMPHAPQSLIR